MKRLILLMCAMMFLGGCLDWSNSNENNYDKEDEALLRELQELRDKIDELEAE